MAAPSALEASERSRSLSSAPGLFTRLQLARSQLDRCLDRYQEAAYLTAIGHHQRPPDAELTQVAQELDDAWSRYRGTFTP